MAVFYFNGMAKRILIVDDDGEFNHLLMDVFKQAGFDVSTAEEPAIALELIREKGFDLVVTDQRFPQGTGMELLRRIRSEMPTLPVIMVSGFLDNDTVRDLIREGIRGIFMKPLNIFSLLKKTNEIIEFSHLAAAQQLEQTGGNRGLLSFPCQAARSREFASRLRDLCNFRRNLTLVGERGVPFSTVMEDILYSADSREKLLVLSPEQINTEDLSSALVNPDTDDESEGLLLGVLEAGRLSETATGLLQDLFNRKGVFAAYHRPVRIIVCVHRDLDSLYDEGLINEDFYLFLGSNELQIPSLSEVTEDIPLISERLLSGFKFQGQMESAASSYLCRQRWDQNVDQLKAVLKKASAVAGGGDLSLKLIQQVLSGNSAVVISSPAKGQLQSYLLQQRAIYQSAVQTLTQSGRQS